jgi:signal transduction histidine kinase
VTVCDNGKGFDPSQKPGSPDDAVLQPSGLANIRKRMATIRGRCEINSKRAAGTEVRLSVPLGTGR